MAEMDATAGRAATAELCPSEYDQVHLYDVQWPQDSAPLESAREHIESAFPARRHCRRVYRGKPVFNRPPDILETDWVDKYSPQTRVSALTAYDKAREQYHKQQTLQENST